MPCSIKRTFDCAVLKKPVQVTWIPMIGAGGEDRERERQGAGLVSTLDCEGKGDCLKTPTGPGCPFTRQHVNAIKEDWLKQR